MGETAATTEPIHRTELRERVRSLCARFGAQYWRALDGERAYPEAFVQAMTGAGLLGALIPADYGGLGLSLADTSVILEEVNRAGGNAGTLHAQMYTMGTILRHGSEEQKRRYLPQIAAGALRLQAFGVTEPEAGTDTPAITTVAWREGDRYCIQGHKIFISRVQHSDLMLLLARTTPLAQVERRTDGLSVFVVELAQAVGHGLDVQPIPVMFNNETNELVFDHMEVPARNLIGEEGKGFRYLLDGLNAERILIAAECVGDGRWFIDRATERARERVVFGRPIGQNQGVQFPLAQAYAHVEAADLMRFRAAELFDAGHPCGPEANMAKLLAADASWEAANAAVQTFGGEDMHSPVSTISNESFEKRGSIRSPRSRPTSSSPIWPSTYCDCPGRTERGGRSIPTILSSLSISTWRSFRHAALRVAARYPAALDRCSDLVTAPHGSRKQPQPRRPAS